MSLFSDSWTLDLLVLSLSIFSLFYSFMNLRFRYWERRGIKSYPDPNCLFGHFGSIVTQKENIGELTTRIYKEMNDSPFVGIYGFCWPILMVCDPQAVRNILIKDFEYFADRTYNFFSNHSRSFCLSVIGFFYLMFLCLY